MKSSVSNIPLKQNSGDNQHQTTGVTGFGETLMHHQDTALSTSEQKLNTHTTLLDNLDHTDMTAREVVDWSQAWDHLCDYTETTELSDLKKAQAYLNRLVASLEQKNLPADSPEAYLE
jgi:hypothetical protein